jgi:putative addiction module CopG family antidote
MNINLSPEIESYIQNKVNSGFYGSASEIISAAIRRLCVLKTKNSKPYVQQFRLATIRFHEANVYHIHRL